jgi:hypothetical protein
VRSRRRVEGATDRIVAPSSRFLGAVLVVIFFFGHVPHHISALAMPKIQFLGRVLPASQSVGIAPRDLTWNDGDTKLSIKARIANSIVNIDCEYQTQPLEIVFNRAFDIARASVNMLSFATGIGLVVQIDTIIREDGIPNLIDWADLSLAPLCTAFQIGQDEDYYKTYELIVGTPQLFFALNDLISAITTPHVSPVSCGRAMDGIKHLLAAEGMTDVAAWRNMRSLLGIGETYLRYISDASAGPRHARPGVVPGNVTTEVCRRSWIIMNRCIVYLKTKKPLMPPEFPLLS